MSLIGQLPYVIKFYCIKKGYKIEYKEHKNDNKFNLYF